MVPKAVLAKDLAKSKFDVDILIKTPYELPRHDANAADGQPRLTRTDCVQRKTLIA